MSTWNFLETITSNNEVYDYGDYLDAIQPDKQLLIISVKSKVECIDLDEFK